MTKKEEMIQKIYDVIEPTFMDCFPWDWWKLECESVLLIWDVLDWIWDSSYCTTCKKYLKEDEQENQYDWFPTCNKCWDEVQYNDFIILGKWKEKRKPIEEQDEAAISFIYSLILKRWQI